MEHQIVNYEEQGPIALITLNRPEKRNALNQAMVAALTAALLRAGASNVVKVVLLKAEGKAFCAGADLESLQQLQHNTYEDNLADSQQLAQLFHLLHTLPRVVVAAVQGPALAGGCGLATSADFVVASPSATFGYTEVRIGFIPAIVSYFTMQKVGAQQARHLLLSGDILSAEGALALGMIYAVEENPLQAALALAQRLAQQNSGAAMGATRQLLAQLAGLRMEDALQAAAQANATARAHPECQHGIASFLNKESPNWPAVAQ